MYITQDRHLQGLHGDVTTRHGQETISHVSTMLIKYRVTPFLVNVKCDIILISDLLISVSA